MPSRSQTGFPVNLRATKTGVYQVCTWGDCRGGPYSEDLGGTTLNTAGFSRTWERTPNYRALKKAGQLPMNPFHTEKWVEHVGGNAIDSSEYFWSDGKGNSTTSNWYVKYPLRFMMSPEPFNSSIVSLDALYSRAIGKMKDADWNAPVFFAEAQKTSEMVFQTTRTLASVIRNLRRGNINRVFRDLDLVENVRLRNLYNSSRAKDPTSAASNAWLQLQYGWMPLMYDVESAAKSLASYVDDERHKVLTVRASVKQTQSRSPTYPYSGTPVGSGTITLKVIDHEEARLCLKYRVNENLRVPGQLGLLNPATVVWELVPFSFVADWFLPIGDYLEGLDVGLRFSFEKGLLSRKQTSTGFMSDCTAKWEGSPPSWSKTRVFATRMGSIPTPSLANITASANLGWKRMISGVSLLRQQASRLGRT